MLPDLYSTSFSNIGLIAFFIAAAVIMLYWSGTAVLFVLRKELRTRQQLVLLAAFFASLCVWAFLWDPAPYYDSFHHFRWLDRIRKEHISFWNFMTRGFSGNPQGSYTEMVAFNLLRYAVVSITDNNHLLPLICAAIVYVIIYYIITDYFRSNHICYTWLFPYTVLCFSFLPYFMVVSGIRNALSAAIAAYALYQRLYKNKGILSFALVSLVAATIHPNVLLPLAIGVSYRLFKGVGSVFLVAGLALFLAFGVDFLQNSGISFLSYLGDTVGFYINEVQYEGEKITYAVDIVVCVCLLLLLYLNRRTMPLREDKTLQFCQVYLVVVLLTAFIGGTNFLTRSGYTIGPLMVFLVKPLSKLDYFLKSRQGLRNSAIMCVILCACLINIADGFLLMLAQFF